jgi:hypothetical protein
VNVEMTVDRNGEYGSESMLLAENNMELGWYWFSWVPDNKYAVVLGGGQGISL